MKIVITDKSGKILYEGSPSLHGNGVKIGTGNDCDIQLSKMGIARHHVQLRYNSDGYLTLQDLQSPFGILVNKTRLQPGFITTVRPGAYLELTDDVFIHLQIEAGESVQPVDSEKIFPFFLNSNENFDRQSFNTMRRKIPRQHYSALSAAEGELVSRIKELSAVLEVTYALNSISSFPRLLDFTLEMAIAVTGGERAMIMLFNEELHRLETVAMQNFAQSEITSDMQATAGLVSQCFENGETLIGAAAKFKQPGRRGKNPEDTGIISVAVVPLKEGATTTGVLYIDTKHTGNILAARADQLLKVFAAQAAVAINRARMFHDATSDPITGIANQNFFLRRLSEEFCRAQRHQKDISLILMDIDHFTAINETHGAHNGDRVLKEVGRIFKNTMRINDLVARIGSDSFAMLLPETAFAGAQIVASKLRSSLSVTKIRSGSRSIHVSGSFGVSSSSKSTSKPGDLLKIAEKALKQAQKRGGNQVA